MTPPPPPLPPHTIGIVLQYIAPPSQLTEPLPPHLLSGTLLQRHHFLNITPTDPAEYLCWPSKDTPSHRPPAIDVLEALPRPVDDAPPYQVAYTADDEHAYAHVLLGGAPPAQDPVRLVFQWDGTESWRYHDASTAPFAGVLSDEPLGALAPPTDTEDAMAQEEAFARRAPLGESPAAHAGEEDDYWNAYGDDGGPGVRSRTSLVRKDSLGEDAYWAQYSSVHGTADSTIPSPLPVQRRKRGQNPQTGSHPHSGMHSGLHSGLQSGAASRPPEPADADRPIPIPLYGGAFAGASARPRGYTNGDPPSPRTLRSLLQAIPQRPPGASTDDATPADANSEAAEAPSTASGDTAGPATTGEAGVNGVLRTPTPPLPVRLASVERAGAENLAGQGDAPEDEALKLALRGLYAMWRARRQDRSVDADKQEGAAFLKVAQDVVNGAASGL